MKNMRKVGFRVLALLIVLFIVLISNVLSGVWFTKLENVTIKTNKLEEKQSIKLLQISDVHNKKVMDSNQQLIRLAQRAQPDAVVITGDLIDDNTQDLDSVYNLVEEIYAITPRVYFVTGNHEWRGGLAEKLKTGLETRGIMVLDNKNDVVDMEDVSFNVCGVADWTSGNQKMGKALEGVDRSLYTIMLAHDPWIIHDYKDYAPDLTLSGHTHGGQIRLPGVGAVVAPGQELFPKLDKGIFDLNKSKFLYIDSGVGTSVFPIRFLNQSQITLITIENE